MIHRRALPAGGSDPRGFTLLETMLAIGLAALILVAGYSVFTGYNSRLSLMGEQVEVATDIESGQRILLKDLKALDPSYGTLLVKDDQGHSLLEYFPDVDERQLEEKLHYPASRTYTMKLSGGFRELVLLLHDQAAHELPTLVYDPLLAYRVTPASSFYTEGSVTFRSLNWNHVLDDSSNGLRPRITKLIGGQLVTLFPGFWNSGQLLLLDTPNVFRSESNSELWQEAPRAPSFLGRVASGAVTDGTGADFPEINRSHLAMGHQSEEMLQRAHPVRPATTIASADLFFRTLPAFGGGQPVVRIRPVRMVRYTLEAMYPDIPELTKDPEERKKLHMARLWRQVYTNGAWTTSKNRFIVAEKLKTVQFIRKTVTDKSMLFTISTNELKKGGE